MLHCYIVQQLLVCVTCWPCGDLVTCVDTYGLAYYYWTIGNLVGGGKPNYCIGQCVVTLLLLVDLMFGGVLVRVGYSLERCFVVLIYYWPLGISDY